MIPPFPYVSGYLGFREAPARVPPAHRGVCSRNDSNLTEAILGLRDLGDLSLDFRRGSQGGWV
jgi:hypothetical protein